MSKLDNILSDATSTSYCAGQDWTKENPTTDVLDKAFIKAVHDVKDLMLELIGEDIDEVKSNISMEKICNRIALNRFKKELRAKVNEL